MSAEAIAIAGVGVALLAVLVPVGGTASRCLEQRIDARCRRSDGYPNRAAHRHVAEVRRDLHALAERVARIEGVLTGPWRPTNGSPAAASNTPPETAP